MHARRRHPRGPLLALSVVVASTSCQLVLVTERRRASGRDGGIIESDATLVEDAAPNDDVAVVGADAPEDVLVDDGGAPCAVTFCETFDDGVLTPRWTVHAAPDTTIGIDPVGVPTNALLATAFNAATEGTWIAREFPLAQAAKLTLVVDMRVPDRTRVVDLIRYQLPDNRYVNITLINGLVHLEACDGPCSATPIEIAASAELARLTFELDLATGVASAALPGQAPVTRSMTSGNAASVSLLVGLPYVASGGGTAAARFDNLTFDVK